MKVQLRRHSSIIQVGHKVIPLKEFVNVCLLGIEHVEVNLAEKKVAVTSSLTADDILKLLKKTGKDVEYISTA